MSASIASGAAGKLRGLARVRSGYALALAPRRSRARQRVLLLILLCCFPAWAGAAAPEMERHVKAAFLYKFPLYVEWPPAVLSPPSFLVIGVVGSDDVARELGAMVTRRLASERSVVVRQLGDTEDPRELHMLFIGARAQAHIERWASRARRRSILLVTESPGALARGAMINFVTEEGRVRFEVSVAAAEKAGLRLGSGLLSVAREVKTE